MYYLFEKLKCVPHRLNFKTNGPVLLFKTIYLGRVALKLFPVVCLYGWQGWTWIKTAKKFGRLFHVLMPWLQKSPKSIIISIPLRNFSDFVTSASCVPDAKKSPNTQNNSWHASRRTQRSIDQSEHVYL